MLGPLKMVRPERFELPTPRFEAWCSIQLSYGRLNGGEYSEKLVQWPLGVSLYSLSLPACQSAVIIRKLNNETNR